MPALQTNFLTESIYGDRDPGNHPYPGTRIAPNLLCKRLLHAVELVFTFDTFMSQLVSLALRPFPLIGNRIDALIGVGRLRTIRHIHVLRIRICHAFPPSRLRCGSSTARMYAGMMGRNLPLGNLSLPPSLGGGCGR